MRKSRSLPQGVHFALKEDKCVPIKQGEITDMQRELYGTVKKQMINYDLERGYQGKLGGKGAFGRDLDRHV